MIGRVMVGLAGTKYADTVTRTAIDVAQRHGAELTGVTAVNIDYLQQTGPVPIGGGQAAKEMRENRVLMTHERMNAAIDGFREGCESAKLNSRVLMEEHEEPFNYLKSQSRYHDLTVLGLKGVFEYDVPGMPEEDPSLTLVSLLSGGVRPILAVPREYREVRRVMVAYSGSVESASTLREFLQLRPWKDVELRVVTMGDETERCTNRLGHVEAYCAAHGVAAELVHVPKAPQDHLLEEVEGWGADLLVLGNSARNILLRRMMGETALRVIREAEVPLFLSQ